MTNLDHRFRTSSTILVALLLVAGLAAQAQESMTDDEFIKSLGDTKIPGDVDRRRLAKIFFGIAATLDAGKSSVELLQEQALRADPALAGMRDLFELRFEQYADELEHFRASVSALLDEPNSVILLYRTMLEGQRTCWQLELHHRLVETYAARSDTLSTLSARESCARFRSSIYQPRVEAIVRRALIDNVYQREEIRLLNREVRELERKLDAQTSVDGSN